MGRRWREPRLDDLAWRATPGLSRSARTAEQDQAAGGRELRRVAGTSRPVLASVYFRRTAGRRIYAYLRWSDGGRTAEQYVCEAVHEQRSDNLVEAWKVIHEQGLLAVQTSKKGQRPAPIGSWASTETVHRQMQANRSRDTRPERVLRSQVHRLGLRYRVATRPLPKLRRTADLVFTRAQVAVFLDGCFWHGCPDHYRPSRRNEAFWQEKIAANRGRDAETDGLLREAGWTVVRVWEHENPKTAAGRIAEVVLAQRTVRAGLIGGKSSKPTRQGPY
jgi:DNA mismatch endonuclease, patch repair protein